MPIPKQSCACGLTLAALILYSAPVSGWAQNTAAAPDVKPARQIPVKPGPDAADDGDATVVTIFGRRLIPPKSYGQIVIDTGSASSCGFGGGGEVSFEVNGAMRYKTPQGFQIGTDSGGTPDHSVGLQDNSPSGNASQSITGHDLNPTDPYGRPLDRLSDCGPSDNAFAAGRSYIARHDTTLKQAYAAFAAKDYPKALTLFRIAHSIVGYPEAALIEGKMYLYGLGTPRDTAKAIAWLNKGYDYAASSMNKGGAQRFNPADPEAMTARTDAAMTLAKIYMTGWDVPKDPARARGWYLKASDLGYVPATHLVGQAYRTGYGCTKNMTQAVTWFKRAGQLGYVPSQYTLGVIYYTGEDGITQNKTLAGAWLAAAARHGHAGALYAVGRMYDLGETVPADAQKALIYYREAAKKGNADAENAVALYFYTGEIVPKDADMARKLFEQAARQGLPDAMFNLAAMYANGEGGDKDMALAYVWMKLAADSGLDKAAPVLADISARLSPDDRAKADALLAPSKS